MDLTPVSGLGIGSGWALVCLFVILVFRGLLVPRRQYEDKEHEANEWRTESRIRDQQIREKDEQLAEKDKQLAHMGEVGRSFEAIMAALQQLIGRGHDEEPHP